MYHKKVIEGLFQTALDNTLLTELIHPNNNPNDPDLPYSLAFAKIAPGKQSTAHKLRHSTEVFIFTNGTGNMIIEQEKEVVSKGSIIHVPANKTQYLINTGETNLEFYCIVSPPWNKEDDISV